MCSCTQRSQKPFTQKPFLLRRRIIFLQCTSKPNIHSEQRLYSALYAGVNNPYSEGSLTSLLFDLQILLSHAFQCTTIKRAPRPVDPYILTLFSLSSLERTLLQFIGLFRHFSLQTLQVAVLFKHLPTSMSASYTSFEKKKKISRVSLTNTSWLRKMPIRSFVVRTFAPKFLTLPKSFSSTAFRVLRQRVSISNSPTKSAWRRPSQLFRKKTAKSSTTSLQQFPPVWSLLS